MKINNQEIDISDLIDDKYMHTKINENVYLTGYQIIILNEYKIDYHSCNTMKELIYKIEEVLDYEEDALELEDISKEIAEFDYYHNTNK